jgi:ubiquinone/menaquinone biosynthesis C-methylase UbiE
MSDPRDLASFYSEGTYERDRLGRGRGRLEFARMRELLARFLPAPPARILDVGGGPGIYAGWLAREGYDVALVDLVPTLVEQARAHSAEQPASPFASRTGDARKLDFSTASADAVVELGPLYHLPEATDRRQALAEAYRVLRPGAPLLVGAISRYTVLFDAMRMGTLDETAIKRMQAGTLASGRLDSSGTFAAAYLHRPDELAKEIAGAGFRDVQVLGVEGPGWMLFQTAGREGSPETPIGDDVVLEGAIWCARATEGEPSLLEASAHLLGIGRVH